MNASLHELKCDPLPFFEIRVGLKRCEVQYIKDRDFKVGDTLVLREFDRDKQSYSGNSCRVTITHIQTGYGLPDGLAVLSITWPGSTLHARPEPLEF